MSSRCGWFLVFLIGGGFIIRASAETVDADSVVRFVLSCRKSDGAFGPADQRYSGQAWTYPAVMTLQLLGHRIDDPNACLSSPEDHRGARPYQALFERTVLEKTLGVGSPFPSGPAAPPISFAFQPPNDPRNPSLFRLGRNEISYNDLESLYFALSVIQARDRRIQDPPGLINFVRSGQSPAGHFYSHVAPTAHAIRIHAMLKSIVPLQRQCILWLRAGQAPDGGFRFSPDDPSPANRPDIRYTFYALSALADLNAKPAHPQDCIDWINSLQNADGGFGDQPGLPSRLSSTFWAVQSLQILTGNARQAIRSKSVLPPRPQPLSTDLSVFQACLSVPMPSTNDLERLHNSGVNLVAIPGPATQFQHEQIFQLNQDPRSQSLPLSFVARVEWSAPKLRFPDQTVADHHGFSVVAPVMSLGDWARFSSLTAAASSPIVWKDFAATVLSPLRQFPAFVAPDNDLFPMLAYRLYDESLSAPVGYSALVAVDAAGRDAVRQNPDLERWIGRLPFVPAGPVHGNLDEWFNDPVQVRVLFWAKGFRLADFIAAARDGLSVCVIRNPDSAQGVIYYGRPDLVDILKLRFNDWQWWKSKPAPEPNPSGETHG